jgi:CBS domain containing-hemolysin-like protein
MVWFALIACLFVSFVFSGIEAGILSLNRVRLRNRLDQGDRAAMKLSSLLARPERLLATVLIVTNLANILAVMFLTQELVKWVGAAGYALSFVICLPIYLIGVELLPKSLFRRFPYRALARLSEVLRITDLLLSPLLAIGSVIKRMILPSSAAARNKIFAAREDIKYFTAQGEKSGALTHLESQLIQSVVDYRAVLVQDVMSKLEEVPLVRANSPVDEVLRLCKETKTERFPVASESNQIIGLLDVFDLLLDRTPRGNVSLHVRRILEVSATELAYNVLRKLRAARVSLASVSGADGRTIGIVSADRLIRSLVKPAAA